MNCEFAWLRLFRVSSNSIGSLLGRPERWVSRARLEDVRARCPKQRALLFREYYLDELTYRGYSRRDRPAGANM